MESPTDVTEPEVEVARAPGRFVRLVRRAALLFVALSIVGGIVGAIVIIALARDLPDIKTLADYRPHQATVVYGKDGRVTARFALERRTVVPFDRIPKVMVDAVIASEDDQFFEHQGLDYVGLARCAVKNLLSGRKKCGGSTITQQTVKTFLLDSRKTYTRKLREMILAKRLEEALTKQDILFLYLNQIYFGHGAYGVQEAAKTFLDKDVSELTVEDAALLAGLPQSPSRLDPFRHPERALERRAYVLRRMKELEKITPEAYEAAVKSGLAIVEGKDDALDSNTYYAAHVRQLLDEKVGEARTMSGGLEVYAGIDPVIQATAEAALDEGLRELDKRQGWRGPIHHLEKNELRELVRLLEERHAKRTVGDKTVVWDLSRVESEAKPIELSRIAERARFVPLVAERIYAGLVTEVDDPGRIAKVRIAPKIVIDLPLRTGLSWARKFDIHRYTRRPSVPSDVLAVGDIVFVRMTSHEEKEDRYLGVLEQTPKVQGAIVSIDPTTREVRAMVGGLGVGAGTFNRATQARRQAGSTFKPFVYATAFDTEKYTPISICQDEPRVYRDPWTSRSWKPQNYGKKFDGDITLRTALTKSKNLCSVELIDKLGVEPVLDMARRAGIQSPLPKNLTLALGSGDVTPLEVANAYATLATGGKFAEPVFVRRVKTPEGQTMEWAHEEPKQTIRPEVTYLITSLMQSVVEDGTAQRVKVLERPVAGKTGTTNESRNAWFAGFTPDLVTVVWVGFDDNEPLGPAETGGRAAIPIWLDVMQKAIEGTAKRDFAAPAGIVFAVVDPTTQKLVAPDAPNARTEPFLAGTEPKDFAEDGAPPDRMLWEDYEP